MIRFFIGRLNLFELKLLKVVKLCKWTAEPFLIQVKNKSTPEMLYRAECDFSGLFPKRIEYILEWNLENFSVWICSVLFSLKGSLKCTNHVNVHKLYAVEYINTVYVP